MKVLEKKEKEGKISLTLQMNWWEPLVVALLLTFGYMLQAFIPFMDRMTMSGPFSDTFSDWCAIGGFSIFAVSFLYIAAIGLVQYFKHGGTSDKGNTANG